jgi:transposase-like protein
LRQGGQGMSFEDNSAQRKRFSSEEKFKIVKEHLQTKTGISELCKKYGMTAASFYAWQELFFENALKGFDKKRGPKPNSDKAEQKVQELESDVARMREVIAEITAENIAFKKKNFPYLR